MRLYESTTNEDLVAILKEEMLDEAFEELFNRFIPMIYSIRSVYTVPEFQLDDYFQEGRITLLNAIDTFECNRNVYFASFLHRLYKNHIYNKLRKVYSLKRQNGFCDLSIDTPHISEKTSQEINILEVISDPHCFDPEATMMIKERANDYFTQLSALEKKAIVSFLGHTTYENVAKELELPVDTIRSAMSRARRKIRLEFNEVD